MKASALEFRLRMVIMVAIVVLGFVAPWMKLCILASAIRCWSGCRLKQAGRACCASPMPRRVVILLGSLIALIGAILRVWGSAYLGYGTVHHGEMQAGGVMADGPYRYVRNPLYLGGWCMMVAMSFLMRPQARSSA